jgi:hypothetical protein
MVKAPGAAAMLDTQEGNMVVFQRLYSYLTVPANKENYGRC